MLGENVFVLVLFLWQLEIERKWTENLITDWCETVNILCEHVVLRVYIVADPPPP